MTTTRAGWRLGTRIAFRFVVVYSSLYVCFTQMLGALLPLPKGEIPDFGTLPPLRPLVVWTATHIFGVTHELVFFSGSGDKTYDWVQAFCLLAIAAFATIVWSVLDRKRRAYPDAQKWFRLFLRFALGSTMVQYGLIKFIPLQMPAPGLRRLLEPYGSFSMMGVLWASIGASRGYEMFAGAAELLGGTLLFFPRTATLGAIVCLVDTIQIFTLNMTYDVPVKLFSFQLIVMSLVLLAPHVQRLGNVVLWNRPADAAAERPLVTTRTGNRVAFALQATLAIYILGITAFGNVSAWHAYGGGAPRSPFYGIWNVETFVVDGQEHPPLLTDMARWRRALFERPDTLAAQAMDESYTNFKAKLDSQQHTLFLSPAGGGTWQSAWTFAQSDPDHLILDGPLQGQQLHIALKRVDLAQFRLVNRGFNWIQEYPFNR